MPNPHRPLPTPVNIQKAAEKRSRPGKSSESRNRRKKKSRQVEKRREEEAAFESAFGHVPVSDNNANEINSTTGSTETPTKDQPSTAVTTATTNINIPPNPSITSTTGTTDKTVTNGSDDEFDFRYNGADFDDSDEEKYNDDSTSMSENLPSTNIGFGSADIFNLEEIIELSKDEKKIDNEGNKEMRSIIEDLRDNCVRTNLKNATNQ